MTFPPKALSMTGLRHADACLQSARLYWKHDGGAPSHAKTRGTLAHIAYERMLNQLRETGEIDFFSGGAPDPSMVEALVEECRRDHPGLHVPAADADDVRAIVFNLARANPVSPARVRATEQKFVLDVLGWQVRGKVDVVEDLGDGTLGLDDLKSQLAVPSQEEYARSFQKSCYATLILFGRPVHVVDDVEVFGEPFAPDAQRVRAREIYPRYLREDGTLAQREHTLTRTEIHDFRVDLERLVARVDLALETGEWPAVPGHHCSICPRPAECPLPVDMRIARGSQEGVPWEVPEITDENAGEWAAHWFVLSENATALRKALRAHAVRGHVSIPFGADLELAFVADKNGATAFKRRKRRPGEPLVRHRDAESFGEEVPF